MAPRSPQHGAQALPSARIRQKRPQPARQPSAPCRKRRWSRHPSQGCHPRAPCLHPVPHFLVYAFPTSPPRFSLGAPCPPPLCPPGPACPTPGPTPWWPQQALTYKGSTGGWPCRSSGRASLPQPSGPNSGSLWKVLRTPRGRPTPSAGKSVWRWDENVARAAAPGAPRVRPGARSAAPRCRCPAPTSSRLRRRPPRAHGPPAPRHTPLPSAQTRREIGRASCRERVSSPV